MTKTKWSKMDYAQRVKHLWERTIGMDEAERIAKIDDYPDEMLPYLVEFECPHCGNESFTAHQQCYHDIKVDGHGQFMQDNGIYESGKPYGPFSCDHCDVEFEELPVAL
jgi:hypothetical protein